LTCSSGLTLFITVEFEWRAVEPTNALDKPCTTGLVGPNDPLTLGRCNVEITLTKRPIPTLANTDTNDNIWNEALLRESAFTPRRVTLTFENGSFVSAADKKWRKKDLWDAPRFKYRLTINPSPYPPRVEWVDPLDQLGFWNWREFCTEKDQDFVPEKKEKKAFRARLKRLFESVMV
jgi:hypothetical protein